MQFNRSQMVKGVEKGKVIARQSKGLTGRKMRITLIEKSFQGGMVKDPPSMENTQAMGTGRWG